MDPTAVVDISRHGNHPSRICKGDDLDEEPANDTNAGSLKVNLVQKVFVQAWFNSMLRRKHLSFCLPVN